MTQHVPGLLTAAETADRDSVAAPARISPGAQLGRALLSAEFGLLVLLLLFCLGFALFTHGFTSPFNLFSLTRTAAVNVLVGLAMMTVIVTGGLDLSVGAVGVAAAMAAGWLMQSVGLPVALAVPAALALGLALGLLNGWLIVRTGLHSFVVTLATMSIYFGVMIVATRAQAFENLPPGYAGFARLRWGGWVSPMLAVSFAAGALLLVLYRLTDAGRRMLAAGGNPRAALLSGVDVGRSVTFCHALAGLLAAAAGVMLSMRNGAAIPSMAGNLGQDWLLPAFLAPVLGGTPLTGGRVAVLGTMLGALLVTVLNSGLLLLHVGAFWVQFFLGALLLGAVLIDQARLRLIARGRRA